MPVLARVAAIPLSEDAVEMGQAVEAAREANIGDGVLGFGELLLCLGNAPSLDEAGEACPGRLPKDVREVRR